jgi:hypothetical protein
MAAMSEVFEYVHVYRPVPAALVFMASNEPLDLSQSGPLALATAPEDFAAQGIHRVEDLMASWTLDDAGVQTLSEGRPLNTDDHNRLATTRLPPAQSGINRAAFEKDLQRAEPLSAQRLEEVDATSLLRRMGWNGERARARRIAATLPEAQRLTAMGWLAYDSGRSPRARSLFNKAIEEDSSQPAARAGVIQTGANKAIALIGDDWTAPERTALEATKLVEASDWEALRRLDPALSLIRPGELLFGLAARARAIWRIELAAPERGREAIAILDELLTRQRTAEHFLQRARAGAVAGNEEIAWAGLEHITRSRFNSPQVARRALKLARSLGAPPDGTNVLEKLTQAARVPR